MKKVLPSVLCLALALCLASCGLVIINTPKRPSDSTRPEDSATVTAPDSEEAGGGQSGEDLFAAAVARFNTVKTVSFNDEKIVLVTPDPVFFKGDGEQTVLNADRIARISRIEEKFTTGIHLITADVGEIYEQMTKAYKSGDPYGDIFALPSDMIGTLASDGLLLSARQIPGFTADADYYNDDGLESLTAAHAIYGITGDGCFEPEKVYGLYYNRDITDSLGKESVSSLVSSGGWTLDKLYELCAAASGSAPDIALFASNAPDSLSRVLLYGSGFDYTSASVDAPVTFNCFSQTFETIVASIASVLSLGGTYSSEEASPSDAFAAGEVLFLTDTVSRARLYTNSSTGWSLAPFPKYDGVQQYSSYISPSSTVLCLMSNTTNAANLGCVIASFNAISYGYMQEKFIEYNMNYVVRDNASLNAMSILLRNTNRIFVSNFAGGYPRLSQLTAGAFDSLLDGKLTFEDHRAKNEEVAVEYINRFFPVTHY